MSNQTLLIIGFTGAIGYLLYRRRLLEKDWAACKRVTDMLDLHEHHPKILSDCLEDDEVIEALPLVEVAGDKEKGDPGVEAPRSDGLWSYDRTTVDIVDYRKVKTGFERSAVNLILCEVKNRHGILTKTEANLRIIRFMAKNIMTKHRMRPSHMAKLMPFIEVLGFDDSIFHIRAKKDYRRFKRWEASWFRWFFKGEWRD